MFDSRALFTVFLCIFAAMACAPPTMDPSTSIGKQAILYQVNQSLSSGACSPAYTQIAPLYNSKYSDNDVRLLAASVYACEAGFTMFSFLNSLIQQGTKLAGPGLWKFLVQTFPSSLSNPKDVTSLPKDGVEEAAFLGTDALMAVIDPAAILFPANLINPGYNPGSINPIDRTYEANLFMAFVSMAAVGSTASRFGNPNAGVKQQDLPWVTAATMDSDGCGLASGVLNMVDAMEVVAETVPANAGTEMNAILTEFKSLINDACNAGCQNLSFLTAPVLDPALAGLDNVTGTDTWTQSGCTVTTACAACPANLHNRSACTGLSSDQVSCAAAGIINLLNTSVAGWN